MASTVSARKRIRQNESHRARNRWRKTQLRTAIKDVREKILHGSAEEAQESYRNACSVIDRVAGKGVIHKNTAARTKSRLSARLKAKKG
jgi:small subunit ribosomal protein S20